MNGLLGYSGQRAHLGQNLQRVGEQPVRRRHRRELRHRPHARGDVIARVWIGDVERQEAVLKSILPEVEERRALCGGKVHLAVGVDRPLRVVDEAWSDFRRSGADLRLDHRSLQRVRVSGHRSLRDVTWPADSCHQNLTPAPDLSANLLAIALVVLPPAVIWPAMISSMMKAI